MIIPALQRVGLDRHERLGHRAGGSDPCALAGKWRLHRKVYACAVFGAKGLGAMVGMEVAMLAGHWRGGRRIGQAEVHYLCKWPWRTVW